MPLGDKDSGGKLSAKGKGKAAPVRSAAPVVKKTVARDFNAMGMYRSMSPEDLGLPRRQGTESVASRRMSTPAPTSAPAPRPSSAPRQATAQSDRAWVQAQKDAKVRRSGMIPTPGRLPQAPRPTAQPTPRPVNKPATAYPTVSSVVANSPMRARSSGDFSKLGSEFYSRLR